jgi:hypothetical protein
MIQISAVLPGIWIENGRNSAEMAGSLSFWPKFGLPESGHGGGIRQQLPNSGFRRW